MSGLGITVFGIIRARVDERYPATLVIRAFFLVCLGVFYKMSGAPPFITMLVIVGLGFALTGSASMLDRRRAA